MLNTQVINKIFDTLTEANVLNLVPWGGSDVIWRETGLAIRREYISLISNYLKHSGYEEFLFPALVPESILARQPQHCRDIKKISFYLGDDIDCYLRATSESQFAASISADRQLRLKRRMFQVCAVFRREALANTFPLIKSIEIDPFIEMMTFSTCSSREIKRELKIYQWILRKLCIPFHETIRPKWDTFPEASLTYAFDAIILDYGISQIASVHNLNTSFARAFQLRKPNGKYVEHTSSGISGRALMATILIHFNENKIFLPSSICPKLISISKNDYENCNKIFTFLSSSKIHILEDSKRSFKNPIIPFCVNKIENGSVNFTNAFGKKYIIPLVLIKSGFEEALSEYDDKLYDRALKKNQEMGNNQEIIEIPSCGNLSCLILNVPDVFGKMLLGFIKSKNRGDICRGCNRQRIYLARFANEIYGGLWSQEKRRPTAS